MKLLVINNIASGYGEGAIYDYIRNFIQDGDEVVIRSTDGTTDASLLLEDARSFDAVVASGGDGTIATVSYALANTGIPVLPFPAGTANLLALNLASPTESPALAQLTRNGQRMDFDLGEIETSDGSRIGFTLMSGAGYDADIMKFAAPSKRLLGPMAYFTAALANPKPKYSKFTITIDGNTIESEGVGVLIVNFSKIQFDISVVHENLPRDGAFDIVILKAHDALGLIPPLMAGILDRAGEHPERGDALEIHRGREITIDANPPLHLQHDGEASQYTTPFSIHMLPQAIKYIVSDECVKLHQQQ